jgi:hypothetical protein
LSELHGVIYQKIELFVILVIARRNKKEINKKRQTEILVENKWKIEVWKMETGRTDHYANRRRLIHEGIKPIRLLTTLLLSGVAAVVAMVVINAVAVFVYSFRKCLESEYLVQ